MTVVTPAPRKVHHQPTTVATLMFVLPDAAAIQRVAGSLGYLSARKYRVHVGVEEDPPGAPNLDLFDGRYPGLSVARLPILIDDRWRPFRSTVRSTLEWLRGPHGLTAARDAGGGTTVDGRDPAAAPFGSWLLRTLGALEHAVPPPDDAVAVLEEQKPNLLVVTRLRGTAAPHLDYLRAARALGIPTLYLALEWDDVARGGLTQQTPDCVAVWNRAQRREAVEHGVPVRRTCVIGAHLPTDVLDVRTVMPRAEYRRRLAIDPARRLVLLATPDLAAPDLREWVRTWNATRLKHTDAATRQSAVVVFTRSRVEEPTRWLGDMPGVADVIDASADQDQYVAAQRLHEALAHADAVVTSDTDIALEGIARARPTVAVVREDTEPLGQLCGRMRQEYEWPLVARSFDEQVAHLGGILNGTCGRDGLAAARGFVRIHGDEIEPCFLLASRLIREITPPPAPEAVPVRHQRAAASLAAAARVLAPAGGAPRVSRDGKSLFLLALPSVAALDQWASLMAALVSRGHRVVVVFAPERRTEDARHATCRILGVAVAGALRPRGGWWQSATCGVSAIGLFLPVLESARSAPVARWRTRLEDVVLPAWVSGIHALARRDAALGRVRRLAAVVDRNLPPSRQALCVIDRQQPDVVVALPSLEAPSAVESWAAHADIVRAARARGIPAAASIVGGDAIDESLAQCALRARGLNRANAEIMAGELAEWLERKRQGERTPRVPRILRALTAGGALASMIWAAAGMRAAESQMRPLIRAASRARSGARAVIRRAVRPDASPDGGTSRATKE